MHIKVIFTGGTIGSRVKEDGYIAPKEKAPYELIEHYQKENSSSIKFETEEPYCILSENLTAGELNQLIACIKGVLLQDLPDGIIVTHGTDTLQYSAAILSYVFGAAKIPILLVSSDFSLEDKRANGYINFSYAVKFVEGKYGKGVFVSYCNKGGEPVIHRGARLLQHNAFSADVESINNCWYGKFEKRGFIIRNQDVLINEEESNAQNNNMFQLEEKVVLSPNAAGILRIVPYVGMEYPVIRRDVRVILHESYHSGTIGVSDACKEFARNAREQKIPIFVTGLTKTENAYETVAEYEKAGMVPLLDKAPIAQYCKLWLALSNGKNINQVMEQTFYGESCL